MVGCGRLGERRGDGGEVLGLDEQPGFGGVGEWCLALAGEGCADLVSDGDRDRGDPADDVEHGEVGDPDRVEDVGDDRDVDRGVEELEQFRGEDVQDVQQGVEHNLGAAEHGMAQDRGEAAEEGDEAEGGCLLDEDL